MSNTRRSVLSDIQTSRSNTSNTRCVNLISKHCKVIDQTRVKCLMWYPNNEKWYITETRRVFCLISEHWEIMYQTWASVSLDIQITRSNISNARSVSSDIQTSRSNISNARSVLSDIQTSRSNISNARSVLSDIQTSRSNVSNTRSVLSDIQTLRSNISNRRSVLFGIQTLRQIYQSREGVYHLISKHREVIYQTRERVFR